MRPKDYHASKWFALAILAFLAFMSFTFFNYAVYIKWTADTIWLSFLAPNTKWQMTWIMEGTGHMFVFILGILTPFLELMTWLRLPAWMHRLAERSRACMYGGGLAHRQSKQVTADTQGVVPVAFAAPTTHPKRSLRGRLAALGIISISATTLFFVWLSLNVLWLMIPFGSEYLKLTNKDNHNLDFVADGSLGARVVTALGYMTGWPALFNLIIVFIPTDRSSSWLAAFNVTFEEANILHRMFGWAAFAWSLVHLVFLEAVMISQSHQTWADYYWYLGDWYTYNVDTTMANFGCGIAVIVAITSIGWVRTHYYNVFRLSHCLLIPVMPLVIMHIKWLHYLFTYGFLVYMADLAQRLVMNSSSATATLLAEADPCDKVTSVRITLKTRHMRPDASWASQVVYLRFPSVSVWQCHPYSITAVEGNTILVHIAGSGNWTSKVHALARAGSYGQPTQVPVFIEGPYGHDLDHALHTADSVVLMAAGVGITPVVALAQRLARAARAHMSTSDDGSNGSRADRTPTVHLWWIIRHASVVASLPAGMLQRLAATAGFTVKLFVTAPGEDLDTAAMALTTAAAKASPPSDMDKHVKLASRDSMSSNNTDTNGHHISGQPTPFNAFLRRFIPRMLITWTAALGSITGFLIASQIVWAMYVTWTPDGPPVALEYARAYNASTYESYYRSLQVPPLPAGSPLPAGADAAIAALAASGDWPQGQPDFSVMASQVNGNHWAGRSVHYCVPCSPSSMYGDFYLRPTKFPYGMGPLPCCPAGTRIGQVFIHVLFPPAFALALCIIVALLCRAFLARYLPLHSTATPTDGASSARIVRLAAPDKHTAPIVVDIRDLSPVTSQDGGGGHAAAPGPHRKMVASYDHVSGSVGKGGNAAHALPGMVQWQAGRPNLQVELEAAADTLLQSAERGTNMPVRGGVPVMRVYSCGPPSLRESLRVALFGKLLKGGGVVDGPVRLLLTEFHVRD